MGGAGSVRAPWPGPLGPPPDAAAWIATLVALLCVWKGRRLLLALFRSSRFVAVGLLATLALALSAGYVAYYLRGGPRIIDATSYWLEARALAEGHITWPIDEPTASTRGRFLLMSGPPETPRVGVIFPPGYPIVLALGFLLRNPLWVGPLTGALLVIATYALALRISRREDVARLAACLSVLSAALRYHTADTMSHGWAALLFAAVLAFAYAAIDAESSKRQLQHAALFGIALGWLIATRPISGLALLPVAAVATLEMAARPRMVAAASALVPIALFALEQRAVTGAFFVSSQSAYYAVADGPPGCFRYGFGTGIGCLHEHGAYVASVLPDGLGWGVAAVTTLRRLRVHLIDVANAEPLVLLAIAAPFLARRHHRDGSGIRPRRVASLAAASTLLIGAYVPFYFNGSYPGGGARFFADALPLEHVLIAVAVAQLTDRFSRMPELAFGRAAAQVCAIALAGFGVHASFEHLQLRDREGGRPFFEPAIVEKAKVDHGLLFTSTDHAFNLAYDPNSRDATRAMVVAREYGDDRDRQIWEKLGHPPSYRYVFDGRDSTSPALIPWATPPPTRPFRFEAEAEWPPMSQSGGYFEPVFAKGTCAWGGRLLAIRTTKTDPFSGTISFPVPFAGRFRIGVHLASRGDVKARIALKRHLEDPPLATWSFTPTKKDFECATLAEEEAFLSERGLLEVTVQGGSEMAIDAVALEPSSPAESAR
jgi:hypothetical protein